MKYGRISGMLSSMGQSSSEISARESRKPPPWSIIPSPTNFTSHHWSYFHLFHLRKNKKRKKKTVRKKISKKSSYYLFLTFFLQEVVIKLYTAFTLGNMNLHWIINRKKQVVESTFQPTFWSFRKNDHFKLTHLLDCNNLLTCLQRKYATTTTSHIVRFLINTWFYQIAQGGQLYQKFN